jgi:glycerol-3-phosphate acyltransferase PlsY
MAAAASVPVTAAIMGRNELVPMLTGFALLVIWKHKDNLARLRAGTEPRVGRASP